MNSSHLMTLYRQFLSEYNPDEKDKTWSELSLRFLSFWKDRVKNHDGSHISDSDCDEVIRILDRNGKGNAKDSEAIAKVMVPQGAWRRIINELHDDPNLEAILSNVLVEVDSKKKAAHINELYEVNREQRNYLTGPSGNTVNALLAAHDPINNLSIISLSDRRMVIDFLGLPVPFDWDDCTTGTRIVETNKIILDAVRRLGLDGSARTVSRFFYFPAVKALWKGEDTIKREDKDVSVTVPMTSDDDSETDRVDSLRESMQIQALIAKIGTLMGFKIWLPKADRSRVLQAWRAEPGELLSELPLGYDSTTTKTIEQIDVLWLRRRSIVRAFEVEHTTSVYSGLLRMADLVALQPNIDIRLHIVAPLEKREKVLQEIQRPVFSLLEGRALYEMCTYLSYDNIKALGELKHLSHLSNKVIEDYEERAE